MHFLTRKECQTAFINYSINHDFIDLKNHQYLVYRHPKLKAMLGADTIHPKNLFKYLRKMLVPIQRPLTDADVEKIRIKSKMKKAEARQKQKALSYKPSKPSLFADDPDTSSINPSTLTNCAAGDAGAGVDGSNPLSEIQSNLISEITTASVDPTTQTLNLNMGLQELKTPKPTWFTNQYGGKTLKNVAQMAEVD